MPTYEALPRFTTDLNRFTPEQRRAYRQAVNAFVDDLSAGHTFRPGLRIKGVRRMPGVYELTWSGGGRATWCYGPEKVHGVQHIVWRRIGGHDILTQP
ncbi:MULTISPECIES: hypothetical protein [Streptomyces]|uniref:hypothetical protein n=1 Tax=Streptomyces TaxID=1883 RepID=UPI0016744A96|nr:MULTISPECIES: hypothetical protein [Streptomyces]MBK3520539.1 hypothetical protein [Streptomyces sp. MBT70]GGR59020.1 hypothetical protein GCM10010236_09510 [Streptomyces eurythermus]